MSQTEQEKLSETFCCFCAFGADQKHSVFRK